MKKILLFLYLVAAPSFSQEKTYLDFTNGMTPTFPGCENAEDKSQCFSNSVGTIIAAHLNTENKKSPITAVDKIKIDLMIRTEKDGTPTVLKISTTDEKIKEIASDALRELPRIQPLFSERDQENIVSSTGFSIYIQKNVSTGHFELVPQNKSDHATKPYPKVSTTKHIGFNGCEKQKIENFSECFNEQIGMWISNKMSPRLLNQFNGQKAKLKMVFDREGKLNLTVITDSADIKNELTRIFESFPKVQPAENNGEKSTISYLVPVAF